MADHVPAGAAIESGILEARFRAWQRTQESMNELEATRRKAWSTEKEIYEESLKTQLDCNKMRHQLRSLACVEGHISMLKDQVHRGQMEEAEFRLRIVCKSKLVVESIEHVDYVEQLRVEYGWPGQVLILRSSFGGGQEGQNRFQEVQERCHHYGIVPILNHNL